MVEGEGWYSTKDENNGTLEGVGGAVARRLACADVRMYYRTYQTNSWMNLDLPRVTSKVVALRRNLVLITGPEALI